MSKKSAAAEVTYAKRSLALKVIEELGHRWIGPKEVLTVFGAAAFSKAYMVLVGPPGNGKTFIATLFGDAFAPSYVRGFIPPVAGKGVANGQMGLGVLEDSGAVAADAAPSHVRLGVLRIQGDAGLRTEHIIGGPDLGKLMDKGHKNEPKWNHRFLNAAVKILDEFTRVPPQTFNCVLPLMAEGRAIYGEGHIYQTPPSIYVLTMNPSGEGTFPPDPANLDRCDLRIVPPLLSGPQMREARHAAEKYGDMPALGTVADLEDIWAEVEKIPVSEEADLLASSIVRATTVCKYGEKVMLTSFPACCEKCENAKGSNICALVNPVSVRAMLSMIRLGRGMAYMRGASEVSAKDIELVAPYALGHRAKVNIVDGDPSEINQLRKVVDLGLEQARTVVNLHREAAAGTLEQKKIETIKKEKPLLIGEELPYIQAKLDAALRGEIENLRNLSVTELQKLSQQTEHEKSLVIECMFSQHSFLRFDVPAKMLADRAFQAAFVNREGVPLLTPEQWDEVRTSAKGAPHIKGNLPGVEAALNAAGQLEFTLPFKQGEQMRLHLKNVPQVSEMLLDVYHTIEDMLQANGI